MRNPTTTIRTRICAFRRQSRAPFFVSLVFLVAGTEIASARERPDPLEHRSDWLSRNSHSCGPAAGPRQSVVEPPRPAFAVMPFQRLQEEQPSWMGDALRYLV